MIYVRELRELIQGMYAEPQSEEGQEVIHNDDTHVGEVWEDGEITSTKSGDLYGHRSIHPNCDPILPSGQVLFSYEEVGSEKWHDVMHRNEHKRMVIIDDELRDILAKWRGFPVSEAMVEWFWSQDCPECGGNDWDYDYLRCRECGERVDATEMIPNE